MARRRTSRDGLAKRVAFVVKGDRKGCASFDSSHSSLLEHDGRG
jgi:hypothetical protein